MEFNGLTEDFYRFFWEIAFNNYPDFFHANHDRYQSSVQQPLRALTLALLPTALSIDPRFSERMSTIVSRIRRDTRYTTDKSPYRDHAWLGFRHPGASIGESFVLYAEFMRESYGYGMGMYHSNSALMQAFRTRIQAAPETFLSLVNDPAFCARFRPSGESFKRVRYACQDERLIPWLNRKSLSFCFDSPELKRTMCPEIVDEIIEGFRLMEPLYRFFMDPV